MHIVRKRGGALFLSLLLVVAALVVPFGVVLPVQALTPNSNEHLITIHDRGIEKSVISKQKTLRSVFREIGIVLDRNDIIEPGLDSPLVGRSYQVNIYRARPVTVIDGAREVRIMSAFQTPKQIAKHAGIELRDEDVTSLSISDNLIDSGASVIMTVKRAKPINLTLYGKQAVVYTQADTVGGLIKEKKITLGKNDRTSLPLNAELTSNMLLDIWREGRQTVTVEEDVQFTTKEIQDADQKVGYRRVVTPGIKGKQLVTYNMVIKNGNVTDKQAINKVVTTAATEEVVIVGSKPDFGGDFAAALAKLRSCEGSYTSNTGNGYYGAYQFDRGTWSSVADPAKYGNASPAEQDAAARALYVRRGWSPWPVCGAGLPDTYR